MKTYTKKQAQLLKTAIYSAYSEKCGAFVQVKAYLKENAITALQNIDSDILAERVKKTSFINSHMSPVDRIVDADVYNETFKIVLDKEI